MTSEETKQQLPPPLPSSTDKLPSALVFMAEELKTVKVADSSVGVNKTECMYCYDTPESPTGLYVCLSDHLAFSKDHMDLHWEKTDHSLFLHLKHIEVPKPQQPAALTAEEEEKKKVSVMGIGCEGGFETAEQKHAREVDVVEELSIVRLPTCSSMRYSADDTRIPEQLHKVVQSILKSDSTARKEEIATWKAEEHVVESKYSAGLIQLAGAAPKIPQQGPWQCQEPGCTFKDNLWLNLTDGSIMCGRANAMGLGNGHALTHYTRTKFPLVVKLGTITPDSAEIYSYDEDCSVTDSQLAQHLAFFGLDRQKMTKTDKTVAELELDMNQKFEFSKVTEAGKKLVPVFGPGHAGLKNMGNTCYLSSVMQVLFSTPSFINKYATPGASLALFRDGESDPTNSLRLQLAKLGSTLFSGRYATPITPPPKKDGEAVVESEPYQKGVAPRSFKALMGRLNPTFASKGQQDALEFLQSVLQQVNQVEKTITAGGAAAAAAAPNGAAAATTGARAAEDPSRDFHFFVEERLQCGQTKQVRYTWREDNIVYVPIPLDKATNLAEYTAFTQSQQSAKQSSTSTSTTTTPTKATEPVMAVVPFEECIKTLMEDERIEGFKSPALPAESAPGVAIKSTKMATFPPILVMCMRRYVVNQQTWEPQKLDALVSVPDQIDLAEFRSVGGLQANEKWLPDTPATKKKKKQADQKIVDALIGMGFTEMKAKKAALMTGNKDIEPAAEWIINHLDEPDDAPLPPGMEDEEEGGDGDESAQVQTLCGLGFSVLHAKKALRIQKGDVNRAADWLLSKDIDAIEAAEEPKAEGAEKDKKPTGPPAAAHPANANPSKYELMAIISHIGKSQLAGHYVCHIKKNDKWVLFNDEKVALSETPPRDMGYLYFFRRI